MKLASALLMLVGVVAAQQPAKTNSSTVEDSMPKTAQEYIAAFERGDDFTPPSTGLIVNGQPDLAALEVLGRSLATADASAREKIVRLLVDLGRRTDPLTPRGADVLRHPKILELLAGPGLAKPDSAREAAMDSLRHLGTFPDLKHFGDSFMKALTDAPTEEAFLLVAKAKPSVGKDRVERLASLPEWKSVEAAKIGRAALGDKDAEDTFLADASKAEETSNGRMLADALSKLGLIGTPRALRAIAERLRTPLIFEIPGAFEKSIRLDVLQALLYNFPDQPELYPNNIISEADYTVAEHYCERTLGVKYTVPPPPFLTYRGYPSPRE
jgi:hypothetical protein